MDGIVLLKDDHKTVEGLFKQFEKASENTPAVKQKIVNQIIGELTTHAYVEEEIFYPAARETVPETDEQVLESVEEHHMVVWMLSELKNLDPADEKYDAKVRVLIENVRHHVEEEENDLFPKARKGLGRNRLVELGEQMSKAKLDAPRDPLQLPSASA